MDVITLSVEIKEDRYLERQLALLISIQPRMVPVSGSSTNLAREIARTKMLAANALNTSICAPEGTVELSPQEVLRVGTSPPGSPSISDLIDEDRGLR